jgi:hypothetical protein
MLAGCRARWRVSAEREDACERESKLTRERIREDACERESTMARERTRRRCLRDGEQADA